MIDRKAFFDAIRHNPFHGLSQETVDNINAILNAWEKSGLTDKRYLAYALATTLGEVGANMKPVREGFKTTDEEARAYVKSHNYPYSKIVNGQVYYGRGLVQLTWDYNYRKAGENLKQPLLLQPDLALRPDIASQIMFVGMNEGWFTGKKFSDYLNAKSTDWVNARRIINGTNRAQELAGYARQFYSALSAATVADAPPPPPPPPEDDESTVGTISIWQRFLNWLASWGQP